jgi:diaminopimelate decarboxylase
MFRADVAAARCRAIASVCSHGDGVRPAVFAAYSFKTNPDPRLVDLTRAHGFLAEVISGDELAYALERGFEPDRIVRNGPRPASATAPRVAFCFADSLESFAGNVAANVASVCGVRLRPLDVTSRFGVGRERDDDLAAILQRSPGFETGVSMHVRRSDYNGATWRDLCHDLVTRAAALERKSDCIVRAVDVGGGWDAATFDREAPSDLAWLTDLVKDRLPRAETILIEPGQAIAKPAASLVTRCLEVRRRGGRIEAVVDAGYNDWPEQGRAAHDFFILRDAIWHRIGPGAGRLAGSTCLEWDVVDGLTFPPDIAPGDLLRIDGAGAYDASMAFSFASGSHGAPEAGA